MKTPRNKVVFIAGLGHSGSTLLELLLSSVPNFVGIGEAFQLVDPRNRLIDDPADRICACGSNILECEFWAPHIPRLQQLRTSATRERYEYVIASAEKHFGEGTVVIDSSKTPEALRSLLEVPELDLRVIHLVKDVRSWYVSMDAANARFGTDFASNLRRFGPLRGSAKQLQKLTAVTFRRWLKENKRIDSIIEASNLQAITISYEMLCLRYRDSLRSLSEFLGLDDMETIGQSTALTNHNATGNRMRHGFRPGDIHYDQKWLARSDWLLAALLNPDVMAYNKKHVYPSNFSEPVSP